MPQKLKNRNPCYIYSEWMENGCLADHLQCPHHLSPTVCAKMVVGIALACRYMHACGVCHRDLKPANILLDGRLEIRIGDLGSAKFMDIKRSIVENIGSPIYMAPELGSSDGDEIEKVDVYSFAIVVWEIVTGKKPYGNVRGVNSFQCLLKVIDGLRPQMGEMTEFAEELIGRCWNGDPAKRLPFAEIVDVLKRERFAIVPDVDVEVVEEYVGRIEEFEREYPPTRAYAE
jgi:serine/threonine protein kinase